MQKKLDCLMALLFFTVAVAVLIAGGWCLSHSVEWVRVQPAPIPVAPTHIELPEPTQEPLPTPIPEADKPTYNPAVPLSAELQTALYKACEEAGVPVPLALGLIEVESCFQVDVVSSEGCYGLCQLNPLYFPAGRSPEDNIRAGVGYLGQLLEQYGDVGAALRAYNRGFDDGDRTYSGKVLEAAGRWEAVQ